MFNSREDVIDRVVSCTQVAPRQKGNDFPLHNRPALIDAVLRTSSNTTFSTMPPAMAGKRDSGFEGKSKRSHILVEKRLCTTFRATFGAILPARRLAL